MRFLIPLLFVLSACSPLFKLSTSQGNVIDDKKLSQIEVGMNKEQVRYLLGSPLVTDDFQPNRWDYVAYFRRGSGEELQRTVSMFFNGEKLEIIQDSQPPKAQEDIAETAADAPETTPTPSPAVESR
jgi:outer membrane protein assembly factor BamE